MSTPNGLSPTCSDIQARSISSCSGVCAAAPSTPYPPTLVTAATTSRQWVKARIGNSMSSISQILVFISSTLGHGSPGGENAVVSEEGFRGKTNPLWTRRVRCSPLDQLQRPPRALDQIRSCRRSPLQSPHRIGHRWSRRRRWFAAR